MIAITKQFLSHFLKSYVSCIPYVLYMLNKGFFNVKESKVI